MYGDGLIDAQRPVDVERIDVAARHLEALREHDLEHVAGEDVLLDAAHARLVRLLRDGRGGRRRRARQRADRAGGAAAPAARGASITASMRAQASS